MMRRLTIFALCLVLLTVGTDAQGFPPAPLTDDEGGVQIIQGDAPYTFPYFRLFLPNPYVVLYDISGVIDQNIRFVPREESQVIGVITSDPFTSPFTYEISLPYQARGELRDLDNNGQQDAGVGVYMLVVTSNTWNEPFLELRDDFVTGVVRSAEISSDIDSFYEITRGVLVVYAPDEKQGFPSGRGADGVLFTPDDPVVGLPQGWTLIDTTSEPFTFNRSREATVQLQEADSAALDDFSDLSYVESFDAMIDLLAREYAFTEYKNIDWAALSAEFRPRIEQAERNRSGNEFRRALRELSWRVPDGHVSAPVVTEDFQQAAAGGVGMVLVELDDGRVFVSQVFPDTPAARAGIEVGTEILTVNGAPILERVESVVPYTGPFSTPHNLRLEQLKYAMRGGVGEPFEVELRDADGTARTVTLSTVFDPDGFFASPFAPPEVGSTLPVTYELFGGNIGRINLYSFSDDLPLTVALWERAIQQAKFDGVEGIVVDLRQNGGGSAFLGDQLPAYFFDQEYPIGNRAQYSETRGEFVVNPLLEERFILPPAELRYDGPVAVLISPNCASACESFAYAMTINDRAEIIGYYPTAGLGGSVVPIALPDGVTFNYTNSRSLGADGEINIEGKGVAPTVRLPIDEEFLSASPDFPLMIARQSLLGMVVDGGDTPMAEPDSAPGEMAVINIGEAVSGDVTPDTPVRFRLTVADAARLDIIATGAGLTERGLVVRVLRPDTMGVVSESYALPGGELGAGFKALALPANLTVIIEVAAAAPTVSGSYTLSITEVE